jgi:hypothetical protein
MSALSLTRLVCAGGRGEGGFAGALEWLGVVEIVDRAPPPGREQTRALWLWPGVFGSRSRAAGRSWGLGE